MFTVRMTGHPRDGSWRCFAAPYPIKGQANAARWILYDEHNMCKNDNQIPGSSPSLSPQQLELEAALAAIAHCSKQGAEGGPPQFVDLYINHDETVYGLTDRSFVNVDLSIRHIHFAFSPAYSLSPESRRRGAWSGRERATHTIHTADCPPQFAVLVSALPHREGRADAGSQV